MRHCVEVAIRTSERETHETYNIEVSGAKIMRSCSLLLSLVSLCCVTGGAVHEQGSACHSALSEPLSVALSLPVQIVRFVESCAHSKHCLKHKYSPSFESARVAIINIPLVAIEQPLWHDGPRFSVICSCGWCHLLRRLEHCHHPPLASKASCMAKDDNMVKLQSEGCTSASRLAAAT